MDYNQANQYLLLKNGTHGIKKIAIMVEFAGGEAQRYEMLSALARLVAAYSAWLTRGDVFIFW